MESTIEIKTPVLPCREINTKNVIFMSYLLILSHFRSFLFIFKVILLIILQYFYVIIRALVIALVFISVMMMMMMMMMMTTTIIDRLREVRYVPCKIKKIRVSCPSSSKVGQVELLYFRIHPLNDVLVHKYLHLSPKFGAHKAMGCSQKNFIVWRCHRLLSGFLAKDHLPRVSCQSVNDKGVNEVKPGVLHRSPGICLRAVENPEKSQLGDRLMKAVRPVIASSGVSCLQMKSERSHSTSGREKEDKKNGTGLSSTFFLCEHGATTK